MPLQDLTQLAALKRQRLQDMGGGSTIRPQQELQPAQDVVRRQARQAKRQQAQAAKARAGQRRLDRIQAKARKKDQRISESIFKAVIPATTSDNQLAVNFFPNDNQIAYADLPEEFRGAIEQIAPGVPMAGFDFSRLNPEARLFVERFVKMEKPKQASRRINMQAMKI